MVAAMALPVILSTAAQSLYNIVDGIFVSMLGEDAMAAIFLSVAGGLLSLLAAFTLVRPYLSAQTNSPAILEGGACHCHRTDSGNDHSVVTKFYNPSVTKAFQLVLFALSIICYNLLQGFLPPIRFGWHRADVHRISCTLINSRIYHRGQKERQEK